MTTELDTIPAGGGALTVLPPAQPVTHTAVAVLQAHAEMMDMAYSLAEKMCRTQLVPARYRHKAEDATAAILYGAELGLNPIQSLQRVISIHGMPSLEARTMVALLKSRGYKFKTLEQSDERVTVEGIDLDGESYMSQWTIERAKQAGYVPKPSSDKSLCRPDVDDDWVTVTKSFDGRSKKSVVGNMKYITDPQTMLKAKCQAELCRDMAPDVLLGMPYSREDLESERFDDEPRRPTRVHSEPVTVDEIVVNGDAETVRALADKIKPAPAQPETVGDAATPADDRQEPKLTAQPEPERPRREKWLDKLVELLTEGDCTAAADQLVVVAKVAKTAPLLSIDTISDQQLRTAVNSLNTWAKAGVLGQQITEILNAADLAVEGIDTEQEN
ncbi:hypothetical protein E2F47_01790 [Mycobacterium eburneum]|nr:hypothetical protein [Mycobacterium eburneum]TDH57526.1 hypothetical protein E2F47_01790 [Mycobacterium eburneum]